MDLRSGSAFWPIHNGLLKTYPSLQQDVTCEVVVIGAGITGALVADRLTREGVDVMVLDRRDVAGGSTSASTALLQYEIDTPLSKLAKMIPESDAIRAYRLGLEAVNEIENLVGELGDSCGFTRRKSLQFASRQRDVKALREEYETQHKLGFEVSYLEPKDLEQISSIRAPAAMISEGDAQVDPFRLTHLLLQSSSQRGARIHDRTEVKSVDPEGDRITIKTSDGVQVHAKRVVFASGFESHQYLKQNVGKLLSTFVLITEPLETFQGWPEQVLIWETANPYLYMRTTEDHRAIIGGEDVPFATAHRQAALVARKTRVLERRFKKLFPEIPFEVAYTWAGTFGETKDGLAYIGQSAEFPNAYFALGFGGNGITYSVTASRIITDMFFGRTNADAHIYRFDR
jgi:glycine/D-amino acid oxidase-like deaminating enzyme